MRSLRGCLTEYPYIMLEGMAEGWHLALTDEQVPEVVARLLAEMTDRDSLEAVVRRLSDTEREALAYVAALGQVKAHVLQRKYGPLRRLGPGRLEWERAWQNPVSATERLWFLGLICRGYGLDEQYHGEVFFVPPEIQSQLPPLSSPLPVFRVEPASPPPNVRDDGDALARDAFVLLSHMRNHDVRSKKGVLVGHELARVHPRLAVQDTQRLSWLQHLCERAGWIRREGAVWQVTSQAAAWLQQGDGARRRFLYRTWLEDPHWNELCQVPGLRCEDTGWRNDPLLARRSVVEYLRQCPLGSWFTLASFVESIHEVDPDFMRPDGDYDSWYIRDVRTGQYLTGFGHWEQVEGALVRYLLEQPLLWLGVVATGPPQNGESVTCCQVTACGAAILGLSETKEPPEPDLRKAAQPVLVVRPDLRMALSLQADWYDRFLLERFARWVSERRGPQGPPQPGTARLSSGGTAYYVLDSASLRNALQRGVTAFLRRATAGRVPAPVLHTLQAWAGDGAASPR